MNQLLKTLLQLMHNTSVHITYHYIDTHKAGLIYIQLGIFNYVNKLSLHLPGMEFSTLI